MGNALALSNDQIIDLVHVAKMLIHIQNRDKEAASEEEGFIKNVADLPEWNDVKRSDKIAIYREAIREVRNEK